jgi:hypothetical protein
MMPPPLEIYSTKELYEYLKNNEIELLYKNSFLKKITESKKEKKWVDIEEEYYTTLKECIRDFYIREKIKKLNQDFSDIKNALGEYLKRTTEEDIEINPEIVNKIYSEFKLKDFTKKSIEAIIAEEYDRFQYLAKNKDLLSRSYTDERTCDLVNDLESKDSDDIRKLILDEKKVDSYFHLLPKHILFLNFNYTDTESKYSKYKYMVNTYFSSIELKIEKEIIHIHGDLKNDDNPIIFGYGDEIGKEYLKIENLKDNEYLANIKSIKYLETDNYKKLLNFINSDNYQIFVFGHSCGTSDRTLLNTLFEHENCASIKVFYHKKEDGTDNYSDVVRNISRNFTNKMVMRDKVVNKTYCESLKNQ